MIDSRLCSLIDVNQWNSLDWVLIDLCVLLTVSEMKPSNIQRPSWLLMKVLFNSNVTIATELYTTWSTSSFEWEWWHTSDKSRSRREWKTSPVYRSRQQKFQQGNTLQILQVSQSLECCLIDWLNATLSDDWQAWFSVTRKKMQISIIWKTNLLNSLPRGLIDLTQNKVEQYNRKASSQWSYWLAR